MESIFCFMPSALVLQRELFIFEKVQSTDVSPGFVKKLKMAHHEPDITQTATDPCPDCSRYAN